MEDNYIIHSSGSTIDRLMYFRNFNAETNKHTHKLRVIKKIIYKKAGLNVFNRLLTFSMILHF
jgi:hypothetical protein